MWQGDRILPPGWVEYTARPVDVSEGKYGAQWWLGPAANITTSQVFFASGFEGQFLVVCPQLELVLLRLGCNRQREAFSLAELFHGVRAALTDTDA